ncbi:hypothetical protein DIPPA_15138 [Diplonema papillatum]|nr:hypothetical protein DIPPA_15138 [Diplonema papillatum]
MGCGASTSPFQNTNQLIRFGSPSVVSCGELCKEPYAGIRTLIQKKHFVIAKLKDMLHSQDDDLNGTRAYQHRIEDKTSEYIGDWLGTLPSMFPTIVLPDFRKADSRGDLRAQQLEHADSWDWTEDIPEEELEVSEDGISPKRLVDSKQIVQLQGLLRENPRLYRSNTLCLEAAVDELADEGTPTRRQRRRASRRSRDCSVAAGKPSPGLRPRRTSLRFFPRRSSRSRATSETLSEQSLTSLTSSSAGSTTLSCQRHDDGTTASDLPLIATKETMRAHIQARRTSKSLPPVELTSAGAVTLR